MKQARGLYFLRHRRIPGREWDALNFVGYTGVLERTRFAIDPPRNRFYFTSPDSDLE